MNSKFFATKTARAGFTLSLLSAAIGVAAQAPEAPAQEREIIAPPVMEELLVTGGRLVGGAEAVAMERQEEAVAMDFLSADTIGRIGDSTVAIALTRVPGVTLVEGKFVFVRGLGERYSSTSVNGAMVPSPDLSRNVLPLDLFPTSIVDSLVVQKVPSADQPASFGGGSVNIRTKGIPDDLVFNIELGTGINTETDDVFTYNGGSDDNWGEDDGTRALSSQIEGALDSYMGNFTPSNIQDLGGLDSLAQAQEINRQLATELYRDVSVYRESADPDLDAEMNLGNIFYLPNGMDVGFLAGVSYENSWQRREITQRKFIAPEEQVVFEDESIHSVDLSGNFSFGINFNSENKIETTSLFLRNTDDEVSIRNYHNANRLLSSGRGFRNTELRYEQRELEMHQIHGEHELGGETIDSLGLEGLSFLEGLSVDWYFSDSEASTDLPNELDLLSNTVTDPETGEVLSSRFSGGNSSAATYRFSDLRDFVESSGVVVTLPVAAGDFDMEFSGGSDYWQKSRTYQQKEFYLGSTVLAGTSDLLQGPLGEVLSDENILDPDNGFLIRVSQDNANSYLAANKVNAAFGKFDVTYDETYRLVLGARWEDYQQVNLPWDPVSYDGSQIPGADSNDPEEVAEFFRNATYAQDDVFGSAAFTWMVNDFWAEDFQLRLSFAETTVRPDLREISDSSYRDPITDIAVDGNPDVVPSALDNFDMRAEWFFSTGDLFTLSMFYKDIENPIELFEGAATDDNITAEIHNATSAELYGVEVEFLKDLGEYARILDPFFVQGNLLFMEHELVAGESADAPTNPVRPMQGASDEVINLIFGFDSPDAKHAATLSYNMFSERLFFAGRNGAPDSYEQPFHSLDLTYSFYPSDSLAIKFKARNLLDEDFTLERTNQLSDGSAQDIEIYNQQRGQDLSLSIRYQF